ncbi:MAG: glycosyltransferase family 4 protein [Planctomycetes bacterium]|nr:glycosyltransferase family 4 protein [Planctomycetota bacterium]
MVDKLKIVDILPGTGDRFYCENCVRDNALVQALREAGHEVTVARLYLPQLVDRIEETSGGPIFYGGINAYLQQKFSLFRKTPRWIDGIFDWRPLLRLAARRAASVRASSLGDMTLSVLKGLDGNQAKELDRLLRWVEGMKRPHVVHLSSSLLLGIGDAIKIRLGVPVVCSLQDEDSWLDAMEEPFRSLCWEAMADGARHVDAFVSVSRYFAGVMRERLRIESERMHVVYVGVDPEAFAPPERAPDAPAVGYLARLSESLGLGLLAEAFLKLKRMERFRNLRLHLIGGMTADDRPFLEDLMRRFAAEGVQGDVKIFEEFDAAKRMEFLASVSVLSVPTPTGVAFGTFIMEALAAGVPVVQPREGAFPEVVEATGGGVLYEPNDAETLTRALGEVLGDEKRRAELGRQGRHSIVKNYTLEHMAKNMLDVYRSVVSADAPSGGRTA